MLLPNTSCQILFPCQVIYPILQSSPIHMRITTLVTKLSCGIIVRRSFLRILSPFFLLFAHDATAAPIVLITPNEAAKPNPLIAKQEHPPGTTNNNLPKILVIAPKNPITSNPFSVHIKFAASPGAAIKPESFKIYLIKLFLKIDLTSRLQGHVTASGIDADQVTVPSGSYTIEIHVSDDRGRETIIDQNWKVA
jgi:hypothetical protein